MKGYRDNGGAGGVNGGFGRNKTAYDDVFGGPPKFGATTLPPRLEDYTEIFHGFHASRGSSIPILDLPPPSEESDDVWFDVQSSKLDYSEVFGGFNGLDFAVSYEELFNSSKVADDDSSDEVWTPAQSESLSDESDPYTTLEMNQQVPTADPNQLVDVKSQNEPNLEVEKDVLNGMMTNDSEFLEVPGSTVSDNQALPSKIENEKLFSLDNSDDCARNDFGKVTELKRLKKSLSQPPDSYESDPNHLVGNQKMKLFSMSDIGLKTQPSHLPPPSRPPPALTSKKVETSSFNSKLKTSKSYAFERMTGGESPPYFDVEIDASSSAAADAAAMKDAVEQAQAKLKSAKELMDRKKESLQSRSKLRMENYKKQETLDRFHREEEHLKETSRKTEKRFVVKTPNESDENELYENLIEIQLKDNEMETEGKIVGSNEKAVTENQVKNDDTASASFDWVDNDVELEEHEVQDEKEFGSSEIPILQIEEETYHEIDGERIAEDSLHWDVSGDISETFSEEDENKKEQILDHNEKILQEVMQEEDKIKAEEVVKKKEKDCARNEKVEIINEMDCNSEENRTIQKDPEREEGEQREETVSENDGIENEDDKRPNSNEESESLTRESSEASDVVYQADDNEILQATVDVQHDIHSEINEDTLESPCSLESRKIEEAVEQIHEMGEASFSSSGLNKNDSQDLKVEVKMADVTHSNMLNESAGKTYGVNVIKQTPMENDKKTSESKNGINFTCNHPEGRTTTTSPRVTKEWVEAKEERLHRERELENERLRKIEEERERQIEREKDRMAVDRATLEARERAFAETRERAERAAVERATAEFRQRALVEARERLEKACAEARERSLAEKSMEGRLRVEKATAEARERAERSVGDKFSAYQNSGTRQNSLSSDVPDSQFQKVGSYSGLRYSQTAAQSGGEGESPQRCKARLERHQRTADRAAKALAEKNMRDLIAQKEQAERNRLAEVLDAEIKRWSSGKQGNLRALLSTLQYILGSDSGWQPVPLTEVITTAAVKKAYRKATLCVHPDKLQQRGATIHQKYICEKVFDLLKEAWNKFNSEER